MGRLLERTTAVDAVVEAPILSTTVASQLRVSPGVPVAGVSAVEGPMSTAIPLIAQMKSSLTIEPSWSVALSTQVGLESRYTGVGTIDKLEIKGAEFDTATVAVFVSLSPSESVAVTVQEITSPALMGTVSRSKVSLLPISNPSSVQLYESTGVSSGSDATTEHCS